MFDPRFSITPAMASSLMAIEADRQAVVELPINVDLLASLRETARLLSTHYSTQIEGNRLTKSQVEQALSGSKFPGRQRDEAEVRNYYSALELVEGLAAKPAPLSENDIRRIHGVAFTGRRSPTPYREGQNVIRDSRTGAIVYLPPEAKDVPDLMADLVAWINTKSARSELPVPLIAACAHYQLATIHPYYDGNGRTARLLVTLLLHKHGYGLKGIYSLDEYYARDLTAYYRALTLGPSHNYYLGRAEADVTPFLEYFIIGMAEAFGNVRARATEAARQGTPDQSASLRELDPKQRTVLVLFNRRQTATAADIARALRLSPRTIRPLCTKWVRAGFLAVADQSRRNRQYRLAPKWANTRIK